MCTEWLTIEDNPAAGDNPEVTSEDKLALLGAYGQAIVDCLATNRFMEAVHAAITAAGMSQAEMPELALHDCYPR